MSNKGSCKLYKLKYTESLCSPTDAIGLSVVQDETLVAGAHKTTERISAMSILADVLVLFAFINVFQNNGHAIRPVPLSARTQLVVFLRVSSWTLFTTVAPGGTNTAATGCLCHRRCHFEDTLRPSATVLVARKTQRLASICV
jgi:hypothetical protein